jgi:hypothetical protein
MIYNFQLVLMILVDYVRNKYHNANYLQNLMKSASLDEDISSSNKIQQPPTTPPRKSSSSKNRQEPTEGILSPDRSPTRLNFAITGYLSRQIAMVHDFFLSSDEEREEQHTKEQQPSLSSASVEDLLSTNRSTPSNPTKPLLKSFSFKAQLPTRSINFQKNDEIETLWFNTSLSIADSIGNNSLHSSYQAGGINPSDNVSNKMQPDDFRVELPRNYYFNLQFLQISLHSLAVRN